MKKLIHILILSLLPLAHSHGQEVKDSLRVDGLWRHFTMVLPHGLQPGAPLVFVLHGYGGNGNTHTWMNAAAQHHGFALCVPVPLLNSDGKHGWNVGYPWQSANRWDDVKAMRRIARYVQERYHLSPHNTFLTGMSCGGEMCWLLAYSEQKEFKALASLAGLTMQWLYNERKPARHAVPFLEIHGTADHVSEYLGDPTGAGGWGPYMATPLAVARLTAARRLGVAQVDTIPAGTHSTQAHQIVRHRFSSPITNAPVWLYQVNGGGHNWFEQDMDTGEEVWRFFSQFLK